MGLIRRGGGGGGGDEQDGFGLDMDTDPRRCETCRRELLPWESTCPEDGGRAVTPGELTAEHDPLLARLLAEEDAADAGTDEPDADDPATDDRSDDDEADRDG